MFFSRRWMFLPDIRCKDSPYQMLSYFTEYLQSLAFNDIVTVSDYKGGEFRNGSV